MRYLLILSLLAATAANASAGSTCTAYDFAQALTEDAPTSSVSGVSLKRGEAFEVTLSANSGQTVSAGHLRAWRKETWGSVTRWVRVPLLDLEVAFADGEAARQDIGFPQFQVVGPGDYLYYTADGVTTSGGTTANVRIRVCSN